MIRICLLDFPNALILDVKKQRDLIKTGTSKKAITKLSTITSLFPVINASPVVGSFQPIHSVRTAAIKSPSSISKSLSYMLAA